MSLVTVQNAEQLGGVADEVRAKVEANTFCIVRGVVPYDLMRSAVSKLRIFALHEEFSATGTGSRDSVRMNSAKWSIGGHSDSQVGISRFMATIYNPLRAEDQFGLHSAFKSLIQVRDLASGLAQVAYDDRLANGAFNATRIQIYPSGGGFMSAHADSTAVSIANKQNPGNFLQPVLLITERGLDYTSGGAYVVNQQNETIDIERGTKSGDIILYDERSIHGVADIDIHETVSVPPTQGRMVGLASIYQ